MIDEAIYQKYLSSLLGGRRTECGKIVQRLIDDKTGLKTLYSDLFHRSMYEVGELWETHQISVAREHLASAITESMLNLAYPLVFRTERVGKRAIVSCSANEYHQIGGKMIADIFEINGWDGHFLGANVTAEDVVKKTDEIRPDIVGLSLSILSNMDSLKHMIEIIQASFPDMNILVGGQAFLWGGLDAIKAYPNLAYVSSMDELEKLLE